MIQTNTGARRERESLEEYSGPTNGTTTTTTGASMTPNLSRVLEQRLNELSIDAIGEALNLYKPKEKKLTVKKLNKEAIKHDKSSPIWHQQPQA